MNQTGLETGGPRKPGSKWLRTLCCCKCYKAEQPALVSPSSVWLVFAALLLEDGGPAIVPGLPLAHLRAAKGNRFPPQVVLTVSDCPQCSSQISFLRSGSLPPGCPTYTEGFSSGPNCVRARRCLFLLTSMFSYNAHILKRNLSFPA